MSRTTLSQILLHISPPPLNISETRDVYRVLKEYGEVEVFKVVRHTNTTNLPAPTAHVIFSSQPRNLPRSINITTTPPPPRPASVSGEFTPPFIPRKLTLTPLPSNFAHHDHVKKIFRTVAAEGIRGLRATLDVPEDAETEEEEAALAVKQNLTAKQREEEPGQYGRLLRLYAGSFRGFEVIEEKSTGNGGKGQGGEGKEEHKLSDWSKAIQDWQPVKMGSAAGPQPPKGLNTKRGISTSAHSQSSMRDP